MLGLVVLPRNELSEGASPFALGLATSQKHRIAGGSEVGKNLKQGHLQQSAQGCVQAGFEHLQGWSLHSLSGQPVLSTQSPLRSKKFIPVHGWTFFYCSLCPLLLALSLSATEKSLALPLLPTVRYSCTLRRSALSLFQPG